MPMLPINFLWYLERSMVPKWYFLLAPQDYACSLLNWILNALILKNSSINNLEDETDSMVVSTPAPSMPGDGFLLSWLLQHLDLGCASLSILGSPLFTDSTATLTVTCWLPWMFLNACMKWNKSDALLHLDLMRYGEDLVMMLAASSVADTILRTLLLPMSRWGEEAGVCRHKLTRTQWAQS